jgi:hypothetical protein
MGVNYDEPLKASELPGDFKTTLIEDSPKKANKKSKS